MDNLYWTFTWFFEFISLQFDSVIKFQNYGTNQIIVVMQDLRFFIYLSSLFQLCPRNVNNINDKKNYLILYGLVSHVVWCIWVTFIII